MMSMYVEVKPKTTTQRDVVIIVSTFFENFRFQKKFVSEVFWSLITNFECILRCENLCKDNS